MLALYEALRKSTTVDPRLSGLPEVISAMEAPEGTADLSSEIKSLQQVVQTLDQIKEATIALEPKMSKFRKRLSEKDPITGTPRYGGKTMDRVQALLKTHDAMLEALKVVFGETDKGAIADVNNGPSVIVDLKGTLLAQRELQRYAELEMVKAREILKQKEQADHQARLEEERKQLEEERLLRQRELEALARAAEASRLARQRAEQDQQRMREENERADREWVTSVTKGEQGVREYVAILRSSTSQQEFMNALAALHALFSQIVSHPEEPNFRRVRCDHPKFTNDIGRHPGGKEFLVASGFRLGKIDEVPSYISTEPNLEKEMDAWGDWFELNKKALEIVEEEMAKK